MIDFLRYRYVSALFSLLIIGAAVGAAWYNWTERGSAFRYSVDFTGGTQVRFVFDSPVTSVEVQNALMETQWAGASIRQFSDTEYLVRVQDYTHDAQGVAERIRADLHRAFGDNKVAIQESEAVGPGVGGTLRSNALYALCIAFIIILCYIAVRFWSAAYAIGAVVALVHDVLIMLAAFMLFDKEISSFLITAVLTVVGYSINDTIVIFSRIRERMRTMEDASLNDVINAALNYTLKRTLLTSITTALVVLALLLYGGPGLADLAFALLVGIIFGTYSSIFIASPVMAWVHRLSSAKA